MIACNRLRCMCARALPALFVELALVPSFNSANCQLFTTGPVFENVAVCMYVIDDEARGIDALRMHTMKRMLRSCRV